MKKITIELLRQENSWANYSWYPTDWKINIDDYVMNWANENKAFVYKHVLRTGEYIYNPIQYYSDEKRSNIKLCTHTKELDIYYYDGAEVPEEKKIVDKMKEALAAWECQCNQN